MIQHIPIFLTYAAYQPHIKLPAALQIHSVFRFPFFPLTNEEMDMP